MPCDTLPAPDILFDPAELDALILGNTATLTAMEWGAVDPGNVSNYNIAAVLTQSGKYSTRTEYSTTGVDTTDDYPDDPA